jgi:hypothetical protein
MTRDPITKFSRRPAPLWDDRNGHPVRIVRVVNEHGSEQFAAKCDAEGCGFVDISVVRHLAMDAAAAHSWSTRPAP